MQVKKGQRWPENIRTKCPGTFFAANFINGSASQGSLQVQGEGQRHTFPYQA